MSTPRNSRGCCIECGEINVGNDKWCKWCGSAKGFRAVEIKDIEMVFESQRNKNNVSNNNLTEEDIKTLNQNIGVSEKEYSGARTEPSRKITKIDRRDRPGEITKLNDEKKKIKDVIKELDELLDD